LADAHHLLNTGVSPVLPTLLTELTQPIASPELSQSLLQTIVANFAGLAAVIL
jgi:hypothetical protein